MKKSEKLTQKKLSNFEKFDFLIIKFTVFHTAQKSSAWQFGKTAHLVNFIILEVDFEKLLNFLVCQFLS